MRQKAGAVSVAVTLILTGLQLDGAAPQSTPASDSASEYDRLLERPQKGDSTSIYEHSEWRAHLDPVETTVL